MWADRQTDRPRHIAILQPSLDWSNNKPIIVARMHIWLWLKTIRVSNDRRQRLWCHTNTCSRQDLGQYSVTILSSRPCWGWTPNPVISTELSHYLSLVGAQSANPDSKQLVVPLHEAILRLLGQNADFTLAFGFRNYCRLYSSRW